MTWRKMDDGSMGEFDWSLRLKEYRYTFHDGRSYTVRAERYEITELEYMFYIGSDVVRRVPLWMLDEKIGIEEV